MRFWVVQKQGTVDAILTAINAGVCTTERQVEAIAVRMRDTVDWASPWASGMENGQ